MSFFAELKRRNVFKVAAAYIIVGWLIMQGGEVMAPALNLPGWVNSMLAFFLILGFPLAIIFAWAFEMTPDGIKKEKDVDRSQSITGVTGTKLNHTITIVLVLALGFFAFDKFVLDPKRDAELVEATRIAAGKAAPPIETGIAQTATDNTPEDKSIAVLPFVNMSDDGANEYFSDGLSEELLNLLAKIPELKVAARTSSFQFKGRTGDIDTIASQLKVAHILEGSVRKSGNQVRITAQLIKADDGYHLWSETYDRTLENIFVVQDEIATAVVDALKVTLLGEATPVVKEANPEAYALFLQGRYWYNQTNKENAVKSVDAYQRAIDIDPNYAPAWAGLAMTTLRQAGQNWVNLEAGVAKAYEAARHSVELDPELALGWVSLSLIQGNFQWNWADSNASMQTALSLEPNASYVLTAASRLAINLGRFDQAVAHARKASALDPLNQPALDALAGRLEAANLLPEAEEIARHLYVLNPNYAGAHTTIAWMLLRQGKAEQALAEAEKETDDFWGTLIRQLSLYSLGRHAEADAKQAYLIENFHTFGAYQIAESYAWQNKPDEAFKWLDKAYEQHDPGMGSLLTDHTMPDLHNDPRWENLLERIGLLEAWNTMPTRSGEQGK
jgi:adenylate cyclase